MIRRKYVTREERAKAKAAKEESRRLSIERNKAQKAEQLRALGELRPSKWDTVGPYEPLPVDHAAILARFDADRALADAYRQGVKDATEYQEKAWCDADWSALKSELARVMERFGHVDHVEEGQRELDRVLNEELGNLWRGLQDQSDDDTETLFDESPYEE